MSAVPSTITLATWNVLHRVHAENWREEPVRAFPDEAVRIAAIAARVTARLAAGCDVLGLQEVSGDQLAALRATLPPTAQVFELTLPRVPRLRAPHAAPCLADPTEHLVTVVNRAVPARVAAARAFANDRGKGMLAVVLDDELAVINTHVSWGHAGQPQLADLAAAARPLAATVVLLGDFNTDHATVTAALGNDWTAATPPANALPSRPDRPRVGRASAPTIDHVIARGRVPADCVVVSADGLSDHNLVTATALPPR